MDKLLEFEVWGKRLDKSGKVLVDLFSSWLKDENNLDVIISFFSFGEMGILNIDCFNCEKEMERAKKLAEMLFKKLHIDYTLIDYK